MLLDVDNTFLEPIEQVLPIHPMSYTIMRPTESI
jgi:hypothetical protein